VDVSKLIIERMQNSIHKYGTTICYNGWEIVAQHPLLNIMFACPSGDAFISSINTTREQRMPITYVMH